MKKNLLLALVAGLFLLPAFTSCSDDDNNTPEEIPADGPIDKFDQFTYLQNSIVEIDSLGKLIRYNYGYSLDEANPTTLSVQADNVEEAKKAFKQLFSSDVDFTENGDIVTVNLTDAEGKSQGSVTFTPVSGETDGAVAVVNFDTTPALPFVSELRYLATWDSENGFQFSPYEEGETVEMPVNVFSYRNKGNQKWVCIRPATAKTKGLLVFVTPDKYTGAISETYSSSSLVREASNIIKTDTKKYYGYLKEAGQASDPGQVWVGPQLTKVLWTGRDRIDLKNGNSDRVEVRFSGKKHEFIMVETFDMIDLE